MNRRAVPSCIIMIAMIFGLLLLTTKSALAFDGNRKGFVLGCGAGVGAVSDLTDVGVGGQINLKIGYGISDHFLLYYSGNSFVYPGIIWLAPTAALSYYPFSGTPAVYFTGGVGLTLVTDLEDVGRGGHVLAGVGIEVFRHWSIELSVFSIGFRSGWVINPALTLNVLGF